MERLLPLLEKREHPAWRGKIAEWQKEQEKVAYRGEGLHPGRLIRDVCDMVDKDTIFVTDVGQHQMWAAQYIKHKETRHFLSSGGLGTMGYGYGAASAHRRLFRKREWFILQEMLLPHEFE